MISCFWKEEEEGGEALCMCVRERAQRSLPSKYVWVCRQVLPTDEQAELEVEVSCVTSHILGLLGQNGSWSHRGCSGYRCLGQCPG